MLDSQLLGRFVDGQDSSAFRDLVDRHGPAVLRACRRHLHDPHEAEDALQATFLILIRRAPSIRDPELLGRWLVGVARRVALRSRRQGASRSERERRWAGTRPESCEPREPSMAEVRRVVREEMARLPEAHREALALCYFEGLTHEQAADRLGWPVGTLKVRLVRARRQLRDRLDRRGAGLGAAFLLLLLRRDASASLATGTVDATAWAMVPASPGRLARPEASFPRAFGPARLGRSAGKSTSRALMAVLVLLFLLASSGGVALAHRARSIQDEANAARSRLLRVLEVDCR